MKGTGADVGGGEVGKALRMIMVHVGEEDGGYNGKATLLRTANEVMPQVDNPRACINH